MITALIANDIQLAFLPQANGTANVQSNLIRGLGVTGTKRQEALPDVPTALEQGFKGLEVGSWVSLFAPAGTPPDVVKTIQEYARQGAGRSAGARVARFDRTGAGRQHARRVRRPVQGGHRALRQGDRAGENPEAGMKPMRTCSARLLASRRLRRARSSALRSRKTFRTGRSASSCRSPPAARSTPSDGSSRPRCRTISASPSSSRTAPAPAATSAPTPSRNRRPTATRCC